MRSTNSILTTLVLAGMSMSFVACSQSKTEESGHSDHQHEAAADEKVSTEEMSVSKEQSQNILTAYLEVKDALVKTNGEAASAAAAKLVETLGDIQDKLIADIRFDAEHIEETKTASHQRDHFNSLSDNVYTLIKSTQGNNDEIYRQYCPMAFSNKGAFWLSAEKEVNNPYFGDMMLHCGSVKETLATLK
jgi:hypothetical protein